MQRGRGPRTVPAAYLGADPASGPAAAGAAGGRIGVPPAAGAGGSIVTEWRRLGRPGRANTRSSNGGFSAIFSMTILSGALPDPVPISRTDGICSPSIDL